MKIHIKLCVAVLFALLICGCGTSEDTSESDISTSVPSITHTYISTEVPADSRVVNDTSTVPVYSGDSFIAINDNLPVFAEDELSTTTFERYSPLDALGRCGVAMAICGNELMPTVERGDISDVYPSGWKQAEYSFVDGGYLYNRCHLIGWQLSGEDANPRNLITGTRYMNTEGMLLFENMIADYIKETKNHVAYRVTPYFEGNNLVASGVQLEAYSIEDSGEGICFNVYCYNVQPQVTINYASGTSHYSGELVTDNNQEDNSQSYVLNVNTKKFHYSSCSSVKQMNVENKEYFDGNREEIINRGYSPCKNCNP